MNIRWTTAELTSQITAPFPVIGRCRIKFLIKFTHLKGCYFVFFDQMDPRDPFHVRNVKCHKRSWYQICFLEPLQCVSTTNQTHTVLRHLGL